MLAAATITVAVIALAGVRYETALRGWALHPRTPHRVARAVSRTATVLAPVVMVSGTAVLLVLAYVGSIDQTAGVL